MVLFRRVLGIGGVTVVWVLGVNATPSDSITNSSNSISSTTTTPTSISSPATSAAATGSGSSFASSCQSALWAWSEASSSYGRAHTSDVPTIFSSTWEYTTTAITSFVSASRITTLCDGHPRAIGSARFLNESVFRSGYTQTETTTLDATDYPTPRPCSIGPSDCAALWSSFDNTALNDMATRTGADALGPPCATSGTAGPLTAASCTNPFVTGKSAQLLYWPVRTVPGTGQFCNATALASPVRGAPLPSFMTGTPTGSGPNTVVTGGVTITSPSVAIYLSGMGRLDGCGPTIDQTIIPVNADQVTSVRGQHAAFNHLPFNYADLNWVCVDAETNGTTTKDAGGDNCYQDVPADAYFGGLIKWQSVNNVAPCSLFSSSGYNCLDSLTIVNDYRPVILPPDTMLAAATSLWGPLVMWDVDGVWDPPHALNEVDSVAGPSGAPGVSTQTTTGEANGVTTPASPGSVGASPATATGGPTMATGDPTMATGDPATVGPDASVVHSQGAIGGDPGSTMGTGGAGAAGATAASPSGAGAGAGAGTAAGATTSPTTSTFTSSARLFAVPGEGTFVFFSMVVVGFTSSLALAL